eukprot:TRINITY_DN10384_c0_g5_i2.p1 TRINITY_DN10384_c0_g5~~TRINITY_DN10384_c0_g5_i2.p1  ORF type:complete len:251 (-),score=49.30 TRINITY_DN10384_c0_g5_i2:485-1237(-)
MGTHKSCPSYIRGTGEALAEYLKQHTKNGKSSLSFLFKVLSISKTLSIQAHPDKELAAELNKKQPEIYKDANHKPELAIALTHFEALYGFLPPNKLLFNLESNPCFKLLIPAEHLDIFKREVEESKPLQHSLQIFLQDIFTFDTPETLPTAIQTLLNDVHKTPEALRTDHQRLALRLFNDHGNDVGILVMFMMNYVRLAPGQSLKIGANELHAYVSGDCIECMATSDNVLRCGLTPKYKDVKTLLNVSGQ